MALALRVSDLGFRGYGRGPRMVAGLAGRGRFG